MRNLISAFFCLTVFAAALIPGCSGTATGPGGNWTDVDFPNYEEIVEEIAPPPYTAPVTKLAAIDSMWIGTYLKKVFSLEESMSLYSNLDVFEEEVEAIEQDLMYNDSTGEYMADTSNSDYVTLTALSSPITFPTDIQAVMGTSIDVEYFVNLAYPNMTQGEAKHVGFTLTDTLQTIVVYNRINESENIITTFCYWAKFDPIDSTIEMRGITYNETTGIRSDRWAYIIKSNDQEEFDYRMGWYADPEGDLTDNLFGTIVGGGDRDDEFVLSVREFVPADSNEYNTGLQQVFTLDGTAYAEGTSLVSDAAFTDYLEESDYFEYSDMPTELIPSPFVQ